MGYLDSNKITDTEVSAVNVSSQPDRLTGTAAQNKSVFDAYANLIRQKVNAALDAISTQQVANDSAHTAASNNLTATAAALEAEITNIRDRFNILGTYATLAALEAAVPSPASGNTYLVSENDHCYMWNGTAWEDIGNIAGVMVDTELSTTSEHSVQNKVITARANAIESGARSYTDTKYASAVSHSDSNLSAAKSYSDTNLAASKTYSDGQIAASEFNDKKKYSGNYDSDLIVASEGLYSLTLIANTDYFTGTVYYDSTSCIGVISAKAVLTTGTAYTIGTLPSGYRPSTAVSDYDTNSNVLAVTTGGVITIKPVTSIASGTNIYFYAEW